ncbi:hypothetical protein NMG60_11020252 [Bertholletia excelsa]
MAGPPQKGSLDLQSLFSTYSNYLWKRVSGFLPSRRVNFLGKISEIFHQTTRYGSRRPTPSLPLPLPSNFLDCFVDNAEASKVFDVLEDIVEHVILNLHNIQKNLHFWQSRAEGSNTRKVYFLIFERGPRAFFNGTVQLLRECIAEGSGIQNLCHSASAHIYERITFLTSLRYYLATFLAQVYMEIDRFSEELVNDPSKPLPMLLFTINGLFSKLEASIGHFHAVRRSDSSVEGSYSLPLMFEKLPEVNQEGSQWTDCETRDAINLIYGNLQKLDSYVNILVSKHKKPRKLTLYWMHYTCGIIGISACSIWLLKHSRFVGSSDIDNWIREAKDSTAGFWNDHVEQPLLSIRDELFETFRKRHKGVMELEEVQLTANSLHRMLLTFSEQITVKNIQRMLQTKKCWK